MEVSRPTPLPLDERSALLRTAGREAALLLGASIFLALTARISLPLPFWPVPITGQTLGVLLVGTLFGPRRGAAAVAAYVLEGLAGLPVFAGGAAGIGVLFGPTGGFLVGFVPAAAIAGAMAGTTRPVWLRLIGLLLASLAIYLVGVPWSAVVTGAPWSMAILYGLLPFLPGDAVKAALAAAVTPAGAAWLARTGLLPR
jgi:biotin transport system substrate-specific component